VYRILHVAFPAHLAKILILKGGKIVRKHSAQIRNKHSLIQASTCCLFGCDLHSFRYSMVGRCLFHCVCVWIFNCAPTIRLHGMTLLQKTFRLLLNDLSCGLPFYFQVFEVLSVEVYTFLITVLQVYAGCPIQYWQRPY
jgi:hypothetical protein